MSTSDSDRANGAPIAGTCYRAGSSRSRPARLSLAPGDRLHLALDPTPEDLHPIAIEATLSEVAVSARLANVPRRLTFPDGSTFETLDNRAVDNLLGGNQTGGGWLHRLESHWPSVLGALAVVVLGSAAFIRFAVPALADLAARNVPPAIDQTLGDQSLDSLDRVFFDPSRLAASRQAELRSRFAAVTRQLPASARYRIEFRASPRLGPNALALPGHRVVMTDELVALARHDEELVAVMAHEVGHIEARHVLRQLFQAAGVSAIAFAILGDVSSISALLSAAPALVEAKFSRDFEREADAFARDWMRANGVPQRRFDDILCRLQEEVGGDGREGLSTYMSTHPATGERARCDAGKGADRDSTT